MGQLFHPMAQRTQIGLSIVHHHQGFGEDGQGVQVVHMGGIEPKHIPARTLHLLPELVHQAAFPCAARSGHCPPAKGHILLSAEFPQLLQLLPSAVEGDRPAFIVEAAAGALVGQCPHMGGQGLIGGGIVVLQQLLQDDPHCLVPPLGIKQGLNSPLVPQFLSPCGGIPHIFAL